VIVEENSVSVQNVFVMNITAKKKAIFGAVTSVITNLDRQAAVKLQECIGRQK
jgi:hypothetical protein